MNLQRLQKQLTTDEGYKTKVYKDSLGIETIGVGRNLRDRGLSHSEIMILLANDIDSAELDARTVVSGYSKLNDVRQEVIVNMCFNMGRARLSGFKKFIAAVNAEDFSKAAVEMLDSKWAQQVGARADRLAKAMESGKWE